MDSSMDTSTSTSTPYPVSLSELHFPSTEQSLSLSQTLSALRRSALSVANRLRSIETDARFVQEVAHNYNLPLIANERCGSWYIPPERKAASVYFKSTDGHAGQWNWSDRRLNLHILPIARDYGGCIIVDSTRRGKLMPDALAKTVPIWCAVVNRALFPDQPAMHAVQFPPNYLGASEESEIEKRINGFVKSMKDLNLNLEDLRIALGKPMKIAWAHQSAWPPADRLAGDEVNILVLCSASRRVHGAEMSEGGYIQGAGDDSESWSHGLSPPVFWTHRDVLWATAESHWPELIARLMQEHRKQEPGGSVTLIQPTRNLYLSQRRDEPDRDVGHWMVDCNASPLASVEGSRRLNLGCGSAKRGSRDLRKSLNHVKEFVQSCLGADPTRTLLVVCETGKDLSAGVLLAIICLFYSDDGEFAGLNPGTLIDKQFIRRRLAWIISSKHDVNPSRTTLQSVHAFLMQRSDLD
ncbi:hypothetical protein Egran_04645 [Elaphomyces granulatus]|uniref:Initiator tRNA phosphoribosyl transferase n=1 Tax=Elaphomyces granulatus TaxID=519963 RepID=A0A232LTU5_9EURO|nr:hypothetical protein Egran_04645 [Elaphomyces granulatus]